MERFIDVYKESQKKTIGSPDNPSSSSQSALQLMRKKRGSLAERGSLQKTNTVTVGSQPQDG